MAYNHSAEGDAGQGENLLRSPPVLSVSLLTDSCSVRILYVSSISKMRKEVPVGPEESGTSQSHVGQGCSLG